MSRRFWGGILALVMLGSLGAPSRAFGTFGGMIDKYIVADPNYPSSTGVQGQIYHYGFATARHSVRSLYMDAFPHQLYCYIEMGQVYYAGNYTPTRHFVAWEDPGVTPGQQLETYGTCTAGTWYTYSITRETAPLGHPNTTAWYFAKNGVTLGSKRLGMHWVGNPESAFERADVVLDNPNGSYNLLQRRLESPLTWTSWDRIYVEDVDPVAHAHVRSASSWYSH